jgi:Mg2+-importing ATPase
VIGRRVTVEGEADDAYVRLPLDRLLADLGTGPAGLTEAEAAARLLAVGANTLAAERRRPLALELLARFRNPLILLLLAASLISALTGDLPSSIVTILIVVLSVTLDFVQEHRAGRAADRLRRSVALRVTVSRQGPARDIPAAELVPGDVVLLSAGGLVPADGRLLESDDFFVNQAALTGEPFPVEKRSTEAAGTAAFADSPNSVFMGSSVVSGSARMLVCRTGPGTLLGAIGTAITAEEPPTAFERGARGFGLLILRLAMLMVLFVILVNTLHHRPWLISFLFAVALAVGLTPELLPMIVSVTLARGALRMAGRQVIVKRLAAIQDLGSMNVLCTDKTGTLTEGRIRLERHVDCLGRDSRRVLELAYLNSYFETGLRSPLDEAILRHEEIDVSGWRKVDEVPFDFERRRVSVLVAAPACPRLLVVKGALEDILRLSINYERDSPADCPALDALARQRILALFESMSREGFRVLGIAWKREPADREHVVVTDEAELVFAGLAAFEDPPKASAASALAAMARSAVQVKVVTGDNELVTAHVCSQLGLPVAGVLTGLEVQQMDDAALEARAPRTTIFCRVTPPQKNRIILALRRRGAIVGYLGDGINDAPPLRSADVGISVEGGVDVAREAADLLLLQPDLNVLQEGVLEGRRTIGNIMKYIMMTASSNFGNMFSMAGATLIVPFLPMLPSQVLLNNFMYDISEVPIPMDAVDREDVQAPRRWDIRFVRRFMLAMGPVSSVFDFATFFVMLSVFQADERLFQTGWFIESLATQVLVIFVIRTRGVPWASRPSRLLTLTSLAVVAIAVALPYTPLGSPLGFVPPPPAFFLVLVLLILGYLGSVELMKRWFYARFAPA